jgi:hypothetical protein
VLKHVEIIRRMQAQYGDNCLLRSTSGQITSKREELLYAIKRSVRQSTSRTEDSIQAVERMVQENRRITVDDIAKASICLVQ